MSSSSSTSGPRPGGTDDPVAVTEEVARKAATAARLFDIRRIIGGLFVVYGLVIGVKGVFDGQKAIDKAQGIRINLWTGAAMLLVGLLFLLWVKLSPPVVPSAEELAAAEADDRPKH